MIPTRDQILAKLKEYADNPPPGASKQQFISTWLDLFEMPEVITIAGEEINPKEQILSDLKSYVTQSA